MAPKVSFRRVSVLLIMTAMSACTASATVNGSAGPGTGTATCSPDSSVVGCVGTASGYSCSGTEGPDETDTSLNCSQGTASNTGLTLYCCVEATTVTAGCTADSSIVGCTGASIGFSCTGAASPDQDDSSLVCSAATPGGSATLYCCASYTPSVGTCAQDAMVQGCPSPSIGFSCSGSDSPAMVNPSLNCGAGAPGGAGTAYCCATASSTTPTTTAMCAVDAAVSCTAPAIGYSCTGGIAPTQNDTTLSCGQGTIEADGTTLGYCCNAAAASACMADPSVTGCPGDSTGYTCTGGATPMTSSLLCGMAMAGPSGGASYCCTTTN
jgi:hypothetical protein